MPEKTIASYVSASMYVVLRKKYSRIAAALFAAAVLYFWGLSWLSIGATFAVVATVCFLGLGLWAYTKLLPLKKLKKWSELTHVTDLTDFETANEFSPYMPEKIFEREIITKLWVMGNGCGKWTRKVKAHMARSKFKEIRAKTDGQIRFLASCPVYLRQAASQSLVTHVEIHV